MTIDISQGCSGYVYGLGVVGALVSNGTIKKALLKDIHLMKKQ